MNKSAKPALKNTGLRHIWLRADGGRSPGAAVVVAILLAAAAIAAYAGLAANDFIYFDDAQYITENEHIRDGLSWDVVKWALTATYASNWHPLTWLSHAMDIELFGLEPAGHHIVNLALHTLSTLLLFGFLRYTTGRLWASAMVAGLFALHPLHVESVAWAAERKDVLSTFFWMCTMCAWAFYARKPGIARYIGVLVLYGLGLMAKPMLVTLPIVLLLLDYWPLERIEFKPGWPARGRSLLLEKAPLLAMTIGSAAITVRAQELALVAFENMSFATRTTNAVVSYGRYIWQMLWPSGLALLYPRPTQPLYWPAAAVAVFLVVVTIAALYIARHHKFVIVGWLWYLITLVPVIGIVQVGMQSHADRYTYVPLVGLFIVAAWGAAAIQTAFPRMRPLFAVSGVLVLAASGAVTWKTVTYWKNDVSIFARTTSVTKDNTVMMINLGDALLWRGNLDRAEKMLRESIEVKPTPDAFFVLGIVTRRDGRIEEAVRCYEQALAIDPNIALAHLNAGLLLHDLGRDKEAEGYLRRAIELDPRLPEAHAGLGIVLALTARPDEGMTACRKAIELDSKKASFYRAYALALTEKGWHEQAAEQYRKSLAMESDYSAWTNLAEAQLHLGKLDEAEKNCRTAIAMDPSRPFAYYSLGMVLERLGRKDEAIQQVKTSLSMDPNYVDAKAYYLQLTGTAP